MQQAVEVCEQFLKEILEDWQPFYQAPETAQNAPSGPVWKLNSQILLLGYLLRISFSFFPCLQGPCRL